MASRHVSNTLSRWHKVVGRIKAATEQLASQIEGNLGSVSYNNLAVLRAEKAGIVKETEAAIAKVGLLMKLNTTLGEVREAMARANVEKGVSALLAEQVTKTNERSLYEGLMAAAGRSRLTLEQVESLLGEAARNTATPHYRESHTFGRVSEAQLIEWDARIEVLARELTGLTDRLSDVNASRLSIEIDEEVLAHLGM